MECDSLPYGEEVVTSLISFGFLLRSGIGLRRFLPSEAAIALLWNALITHANAGYRIKSERSLLAPID